MALLPPKCSVRFARICYGHYGGHPCYRGHRTSSARLSRESWSSPDSPCGRWCGPAARVFTSMGSIWNSPKATSAMPFHPPRHGRHPPRLPCRCRLPAMGARPKRDFCCQCRRYAQRNAGGGKRRRRARGAIPAVSRRSLCAPTAAPANETVPLSEDGGNRRLQAQQNRRRTAGRGDGRKRGASRCHRQPLDADRAPRRQADADRPHHR